MIAALPLIAELRGELSFAWSSEVLYVEKNRQGQYALNGIDGGVVLLFPGCETRLELRSDVLDLEVLWNSVERPGHYRILNCTCGYADDAEVGGGVRVSHPDAQTIVWEIDVSGLQGALTRSPPWSETDGLLRLVFERADYEAAVRAIVKAAQARVAAPVPWDAIGHARHFDVAQARHEFPHVSVVPILYWNPEFDGDDLERLQAMDADAPFQRDSAATSPDPGA